MCLTCNLIQDYKGMGVVYVGHIPKNFQEKEMRSFFEQFGDILKLRLSRSKKVNTVLLEALYKL